MIDMLLLQPVRDICATWVPEKVYGDVIWCLDNVYLTLSCSFFLPTASMWPFSISVLKYRSDFTYLLLVTPGVACMYVIWCLDNVNLTSHSCHFYREWVILPIWTCSQIFKVWVVHRLILSLPQLQKVHWWSKYVTLPLTMTLYCSSHRKYVISFDVFVVPTWLVSFSSGKSQKYIETDIAYIAPIAPLQAPQYIVLYSFL